MLSWTPILILAVIGLMIFWRRYRSFGTYLAAAFLAFYYVIAIQPTWDGMSSFGSRYFVSLSPLFVLGLSAFFDWLARSWRERPAAIFAFCTTAFLVVWNLGLVFQWGVHLIPSRGPISFRAAAYNQVAVVPREAARSMESYVMRRHQLMNRIEEEDVHHLKSSATDGNK
jgi:hypothetical protein